jgi:GTPase
MADTFQTGVATLNQLADSIFADIQERQQAGQRDTATVTARIRRKLSQLANQVSVMDDDLDQMSKTSRLYVDKF